MPVTARGSTGFTSERTETIRAPLTLLMRMSHDGRMSDKPLESTNLGLALDQACRRKRNGSKRPDLGLHNPLVEPLRTAVLTEYATTGISVRALASKHHVERSSLMRAITATRREALEALRLSRLPPGEQP